MSSPVQLEERKRRQSFTCAQACTRHHVLPTVLNHHHRQCFRSLTSCLCTSTKHSEQWHIMGSLFSSCIKPSGRSGGQRLGSGPSSQSNRVPASRDGAVGGSALTGNPPAASGAGAGAQVGGSNLPLPHDRETRAQLVAAKAEERMNEVRRTHTSLSRISYILCACRIRSAVFSLGAFLLSWQQQARRLAKGTLYPPA